MKIKKKQSAQVTRTRTLFKRLISIHTKVVCILGGYASGSQFFMLK